MDIALVCIDYARLFMCEGTLVILIEYGAYLLNGLV